MKTRGFDDLGFDRGREMGGDLPLERERILRWIRSKRSDVPTKVSVGSSLSLLSPSRRHDLAPRPPFLCAACPRARTSPHLLPSAYPSPPAVVRGRGPPIQMDGHALGACRKQRFHRAFRAPLDLRKDPRLEGRERERQAGREERGNGRRKGTWRWRSASEPCRAT